MHSKIPTLLHLKYCLCCGVLELAHQEAGILRYTDTESQQRGEKVHVCRRPRHPLSCAISVAATM
jgi:hypothetical protein